MRRFTKTNSFCRFTQIKFKMVARWCWSGILKKKKRSILDCLALFSKSNGAIVCFCDWFRYASSGPESGNKVIPRFGRSPYRITTKKRLWRSGEEDDNFADTSGSSSKEKMIDKETILIRLGFEPVNRRDKNALLIHACPGDTWEPIEYIPGMKVRNITRSINHNELTSMSLLSAKYQYVLSISSIENFALVRISKKGRWAKNRNN